MGAAQVLALEQFLEGKGFIRRGLEGGVGGLLTGSGAKLLRASDLPARRAHPVRRGSGNGVDAFLEELPDSRLVEIVGRRSSGRFSIALAALASVTGGGQDAAFVDLGGALDPQAAAQAGADLARLLWVRPRKVKEALAAAEMLIAAGFRLVVADLGLAPRGGRFVPDAAWVRLSRAVEAQRSTLLLLVPYRMSGSAAGAVVSVQAPRPIWRGSGNSPRLLAGIASRLTLEKLGRQTPGRAAAITLSVAEAIPDARPPNAGAGLAARVADAHVGAGVSGGGPAACRALRALGTPPARLSECS